MSNDKELDDMMRRMRAHLRASSSRGKIRGIDPDNPFEIMRHEQETKDFDNLSDKEISITYGLFGTDDDVVSCEAEYDRHYRNKMVFIGGHRLTDDVIHDYVVEAILKLL